MALIDKDELLKLSPEERLEKLRKLKEKKEKELEAETKKIMEDTIREIQEKQKKLIEDIKLPEQKHVDIEQLFSGESIDDKADIQPSEQEIIEAEKSQYKLADIAELYDELNAIKYNTQNSQQNINSHYEMQEKAAEIYQRIKDFSQKIDEDAAKDIAQGSRRIMRQLFGSYAAETKYHP